MPLSYYPKPGEIVLCDYRTGFLKDELQKRRPVVIVSPRLRKRGHLCTVVPLSTTDPDEVQSHHFWLELANPLPEPYSSPTMWAKCDMVGTVSMDRLDRFKDGRTRNGGHARRFRTGEVSKEQLVAIKKGVLCGLGLSSLTIHL